MQHSVHKSPVSSDGTTALVGGTREGTRGGGAWEFQRLEGAWYHRGPPLAADIGGLAAAMSADGDVAFIGRPAASHGAGSASAFPGRR